MRPLLHRIALPLVHPRARITVLVAVVALLAGQFTDRGQFQVPALLQAQAWEYLSDRPWEFADTAWLMMGNEGTPVGDGAFLTGSPLAIGNHVYGKGFGVFTPSDITFQLHGAFARLEGLVGVEPDDRPEPSSRRRVRFVIYGDGRRLLETALLDVGPEPHPIALSIRGVQQLRLATEREPDAPAGARAVWADIRVQRELPNPTVAARAEIDLAAQARMTRTQRLADNREQWAADSSAAEQAVVEAAGGTGPTTGQPPVVLAAGRRLLLVNASMAVMIGVAGGEGGRISVLNREPARFLAQDLTAQAFDDAGQPLLDLTEAEPEPWSATTSRIVDPALGAGTQLSVPFAAPNLRIVLTFVLFDGPGSLYLDALVESTQPGAALPAQVRYLTAGEGSLFTGAEAHYLTNLVRLRYVPVHDDGQERRDYLGWSNPLYVYEPERRTGLMLAALDETRRPPWFSVRRQPDTVHAEFALNLPGLPHGAAAVRAPRLLLRALNGEPMQQGFEDYRRVVGTVAPPPPLPDWMGPQWLSWYVYYMDMTEALLVQQIDAIDRHFGDLGPWHILVDAGWYWAEGRAGAEWLRPDQEKFPRGLRWLVDYAHSKGIRVVLYFTGPYLNTNRGAGNWLGLRGIIDQHPEWLLPLDAGASRPVDYVYDMTNPELRSYLQRVFEQIWVEYGVDGLKLDGLGSAGESVLVSAEGAANALSAKAFDQTFDLYRLVYQEAMRHNPKAYIESGWLTPTLANQYAHTFRYGDEETVFSRTYPLPGLMQHVDFTAYQQAVLGQRSNVGAIWGEPNESVVNLWWLGAALALDAQVSVSLDLTALTPESVSLYRSLLAHYRPFSGVTRISPDLDQEVFSTNRNGTHYVGIVNRSTEERSFTVTAAALGMDPDATFGVYDTELRHGVPATGSVTVDLEPESFRLLAVRAEAGVLWGNVRALPDGPNAWRVTAPGTVPGHLVLYTPERDGPLYWDNLPLVPEAGDGTLATVETLAHSSLRRVLFPPGGAHRLQMEP